MTETPIPTVLFCPACGKQHVDEGEWATRPHRRHLCVDDRAGRGCGHLWEPEQLSVGRWLPPAIRLCAAGAAFRMLVRVRDRTRLDGDPYGDAVRDTFFTLMSAESTWPTASFNEWLEWRDELQRS